MDGLLMKVALGYALYWIISFRGGGTFSYRINWYVILSSCMYQRRVQEKQVDAYWTSNKRARRMWKIQIQRNISSRNRPLLLGIVRYADIEDTTDIVSGLEMYSAAYHGAGIMKRIQKEVKEKTRADKKNVLEAMQCDQMSSRPQEYPWVIRMHHHRASTQTVIDSGENAPICMHANVEILWLVITSTRLAMNLGWPTRSWRVWEAMEVDVGNILVTLLWMLKTGESEGWLRLSGEWMSKNSVNKSRNWGSSPTWIDGTQGSVGH